MEEVRTSIEIDAPPSRVWEVLTDFAGYEDWNPLIPKIRGRLEPGAPVDFKIAEGKARIPIAARMLRVETERDFRWRGPRSDAMGKLICGEHYFTLEDMGDGKTRFVHGEQFRGPLVPLLWKLLERRLAGAYTLMNVAVKKEAEKAG